MKIVKQAPAPMALLQEHGVEFISTNQYGLHIISVPAKLTIKQLADFIVAANSLRFDVRIRVSLADTHSLRQIDQTGLQMVMESY